MRLCNPCFKLLPGDAQRAIAAARSAGRFADLSQLVRDAAQWLAEHSPAVLAARRIGEAPP